MQDHSDPVPYDKINHLYLYAIVRDDLEMHLHPGKLAAQAGHAYTDSLMVANQIDPALVSRYCVAGLGGSKVTLKAKNQNQLLRAYNEALSAGLPCAIVVDRNHVLPPHFNGFPIITALGIGPCTQEKCRHITKRYRCV